MCRSKVNGGRRCPGDGGAAYRQRLARRRRQREYVQPQLDWQQDLAQWESAGVHGSGLADAWTCNGFTPQDAKPWVDAGIADPNEAAAWRDNGWLIPRARSWREAGHTCEQATRYRDVDGVRTASQLANSRDNDAVARLSGEVDW